LKLVYMHKHVAVWSSFWKYLFDYDTTVLAVCELGWHALHFFGTTAWVFHLHDVPMLPLLCDSEPSSCV
jgi:hypothetical protein